MQLFLSSTRPAPLKVQSIRARYRSLIQVHSEQVTYKILRNTFGIDDSVILDIMTLQRIRMPKVIMAKIEKEEIDIEIFFDNRVTNYPMPPKQSWFSGLGVAS